MFPTTGPEGPLTATGVEAVRVARSEVRLRPAAEDPLQDAQSLGASLGVSTAGAAQSAQHRFDEALAAGRGRTVVRHLRHALGHAEETARGDDGRVVDAVVVPFDSLRKRVDESHESAGSFSGPPLKA
ncbi:hypothetical protein [Streptomyces malaysiensis]|uniref:Uncharacterized protein n=1 Tax=Streptomyces malaysiensis subsp. samsunensis TaxID=459658 RepID=A0A9X2M091_STRMQ|nr:hypothetical protein [Streptomyces samsunensis]MCQ8833825.1 hypothetical protein [Streptomyces samsunensis]